MLSDGSIHCYFISNWSANAFEVQTVATGFNNGAWHHVVLTYSGTSTAAGVNIYVDNINRPLTVIRNSLTGTMLNDITLKIGTRTSDASLRLNGIVDEVAVYSRVLSATEIGLHYINTKLLRTNGSQITSLEKFYGNNSLLVNGAEVIYNSTTRVTALDRIPFLDSTKFRKKWVYSDTCRLSAHVYNAGTVGYPKLGIKGWGYVGGTYTKLIDTTRICSEASPNALDWRTITLGVGLDTTIAKRWKIQAFLSGSNSLSKIYFDNVSIDNGRPVFRYTGGPVGITYDTIPFDTTVEHWASRVSRKADNANIQTNTLYYYGIIAEDNARIDSTYSNTGAETGTNFGYFGTSPLGASGVEDYVYTDTVAPWFDSTVWARRRNYWEFAAGLWRNDTTSYGYTYDSVMADNTTKMNGTTKTVFNYNTTRADFSMETFLGTWANPAGKGVGNKYKWGDWIRLEVRTNKEELTYPTVTADFYNVNPLTSGLTPGTYIGKDGSGRYIFTFNYEIRVPRPDYGEYGANDYPVPPFNAASGYIIPFIARDRVGNSSPNDVSFSVMLDNSPPNWTWIEKSAGSGYGTLNICESYWMFNGNSSSPVYDSSGRTDYVGTMFGGAKMEKEMYLTPDQSTLTVLKLDSDNSYVRFRYVSPDNPVDLLGGKGFTKVTWEAWMYVNSTAGFDGQEQSIVSTWNDAGGARTWKFGVDGTKLRLDLRVVGDSGAYPAYNTTMSGLITVPGNWYHVVAVYDAAPTSPRKNVQFYVNGNLKAEYDRATNGAVQAKEAAENLIVGGAGNGTILNFNGHIDEMYIYSGALTPTQIKEHYQQRGVRIRKQKPPIR
ncbi:LamG domain-containing protein [Candidatus Desantisbacteria bacterium]|nr:LamG domain-containing protein [Candidatus Desantisbacteria bacterium]